MWSTGGFNGQTGQLRRGENMDLCKAAAGVLRMGEFAFAVNLLCLTHDCIIISVY